MIIRCAWCKRIIGTKPPFGGKYEKEITDGICPSCELKYFGRRNKNGAQEIGIKEKKAGAQREANRKLHQKGNKIMADQKEDVTGNGGEKVVTPEEKAYVEDTQKLEPEVTTDMPHAAVGQAFTPPEVDCPHKTIRDWPGCFEDCDYAGMDECPHHVSYEPEIEQMESEIQQLEDERADKQLEIDTAIDSGKRDLEPEPFDPKSVIAKYLKK